MLLTHRDLTTKRSQNYTSSLEIASERGGNSKAPCFARRAASAGGARWVQCQGREKWPREKWLYISYTPLLALYLRLLHTPGSRPLSHCASLAGSLIWLLRVRFH